MKKKKILIVLSRYNESIGNQLKKSAIDYLLSHSRYEKYIVEAPGSFEIPSIIERYIKKYDGVIALGCIIKGETNNFELISKSITDALMKLSIIHKKPIGNGVITCFNDDQARQRTNKGAEAAAAVISALNLKGPLKI